MLPSGSEEGTSYQWFFYIQPYQEQEQHENVHSQHWPHSEHHSYGFPLDRAVKHEEVYDVPNAQFLEVQVTHNPHHYHHES